MPRGVPKDRHPIIGYVRVSTQEQGLSFHAQEQAIREYAARNDTCVEAILQREGEWQGRQLP